LEQFRSRRASIAARSSIVTRAGIDPGVAGEQRIRIIQVRE
jgi:hypothetical protein